jgi:hypothetical protein
MAVSVSREDRQKPMKRKFASPETCAMLVTRENAPKSPPEEKFFNIAGPNVPEDHYMLAPLRRVNYDEISRLIDQKQYFVLHAPRQTGKTTSMLAMAREINGESRYRCAYINVEPAQTARNNVETGMKAILSAFGRASERFLGIEQPAGFISSLIKETSAHDALRGMLGNFCKKLDRPLVLFIDEIDSLIGDTLVSVLRQLRSGYADRPKEFPAAAILCGVRVDLLVRWRYPRPAGMGKGREQRIVLELKTIRASSRDPQRALSEGLEQTARYAEQSDAAEAHLIVCDERAGRGWDEKIYDRVEGGGENGPRRAVHVWGV